MLSQPGPMIFWMILVVVFSFGVCSMGLQKGVERVNKFMMTCLLLIMAVLAVRSCLLDGAAEGLTFYLKPDFGKMMESGFGEVVFAAMGQAFFTPVSYTHLQMKKGCKNDRRNQDVKKLICCVFR